LGFPTFFRAFFVSSAFKGSCHVVRSKPEIVMRGVKSAIPKILKIWLGAHFDTIAKAQKRPNGTDRESRSIGTRNTFDTKTALK
jgi:hypothetical protein